MTSTSQERPRRSPLIAAGTSGFLGLFLLANGLERPTIADMRTVDLVHLLATGALLGIGLVGVAWRFVGPKKS